MILDELLSCVEMTESKGSGGNSPTVCFTGKMPEKRSFYEDLARKHGYEPADSVNASLSILVCADPNENSSKLQKARKNNVPVMELNEWIASLSEIKTPETPETPEIPEEKTEESEPEKEIQPDLFDNGAELKQTFFDF